MTKQRPNPDKIANELVGASSFFRPAPAPKSEPTPAVVSSSPAPSSDTSSTHDVTTSRRPDVTPSPAAPAGFDINRETASRDSLRLAIDETKAVDALRASLKWDYDLTVSKNDICRAALHSLLEDFAAKADKSHAVTRLKRKRLGRQETS